MSPHSTIDVDVRARPRLSAVLTRRAENAGAGVVCERLVALVSLSGRPAAEA